MQWSISLEVNARRYEWWTAGSKLDLKHTYVALDPRWYSNPVSAESLVLECATAGLKYCESLVACLLLFKKIKTFPMGCINMPGAISLHSQPPPGKPGAGHQPQAHKLKKKIRVGPAHKLFSALRHFGQCSRLMDHVYRILWNINLKKQKNY